MAAAGEGRRQLGKPSGVLDGLLRNRLLLEGPHEIEIRHRHEEKQVVGGGRDGVLPCRHLLIGDARLENRVREAELGGDAGNRRSAAAHRIHSQAAF